MAAVDVSSEIVIACPRDHVARYAADPDNVPEWYANIRSVEWKTSPAVVVGSRNRGRPSGFSSLMVPFIAVMMRRVNRRNLKRLKQLLEDEFDRGSKS